MTAVTIAVVALLVVAVLSLVGAVAYFASVLPRRVAQLVRAEQAAGDTRALATQAGLQEAITASVEVTIAPFRALLEEQSQHVLTVRQRAKETAQEAEKSVAALRALCEWFGAFASALYTQASTVPERRPPVARERAGAGTPAPTLVSMQATPPNGDGQKEGTR